MTFQETLKELRAKKRITQKELAKMVGVSPVQLNRYENGTIRPRLPILSRLAEILEVDYSVLSNTLNPTHSTSEIPITHKKDLNAKRRLTKMKLEFEKLPVQSKLSFFSFASNSLALELSEN